MESIATRLLCRVHRLIGMTQQCVGIRAINGEKRDADAGRNDDAVAADGKWRSQGGEYSADSVVAIMDIANTSKEQDEFVTAESRNGVAGTYALAQTLGHFNQHAVASGVAVLIIGPA